MKSEKLHRIRLMNLMVLIGLAGLIGCSKDEATGPKAENPTEIHVAGYVASYEEISKSNRANGLTRGWIPPSGYSLFENSDQSISVFFTQGTTSGDERYFFKSNGKWRISGEGENAIEAGEYYLYGYAPYEKSINTTVNVLSGNEKKFANGAVVTMRNVPTVSTADFCVMIAAKNGKDDYDANADYSVTGLQRGKFQYVAPGGGNNYVFLLFDHLFSALRMRMRVQGDYNALRTIKLKELKLKTYEGETPTKKKTDVTITLTANNDASNPITNVTFTPTGTDTESGTVFTSSTGHALNEDYQEFTGHFMPQGVTTLILESTYDVYDKKGNLVRQGCTATNKLDLSDLFNGQTEAMRGSRYTINLTINPTYLYMLSEPDLDDPTVMVE